MAIEDYPSNSRRRAEQANETEPEIKAPKLQKVVTGQVIKRKKPLGRRLRETFFSSDSNSVIGYLAKEVLLPALQNLVTDFVTQGINKAVYGDAHVHRTSPRVGGYTSPGRTYTSYNRPDSIVRAPVSNSGPAAYRREPQRANTKGLDDIIVESKIAAEAVYESLSDLVQQYGVATVANLNEALGQTSTMIDYKFGWTDLSKMDIRHVSQGWLIMMPPLEDLK